MTAAEDRRWARRFLRENVAKMQWYGKPDLRRIAIEAYRELRPLLTGY